MNTLIFIVRPLGPRQTNATCWRRLSRHTETRDRNTSQAREQCSPASFCASGKFLRVDCTTEDFHSVWKLTSFSGKLSGLCGKFSGLSGKFSRLSRKFSGLSGKFSGLSGKFSGLSGKFSGLSGKIS